MSTNQQIADLLAKQTYAERMEFAQFLSSAAIDYVTDNGSDALKMDADYFANLLDAWIDEQPANTSA
jgi:hypothetical protein